MNKWRIESTDGDVLPHSNQQQVFLWKFSHGCAFILKSPCLFSLNSWISHLKMISSSGVWWLTHFYSLWIIFQDQCALIWVYPQVKLRMLPPADQTWNCHQLNNQSEASNENLSLVLEKQVLFFRVKETETLAERLWNQVLSLLFLQ